MSGLDSLTPIAPMVPPKYLSVTGSQVLPPSVVLKTPPPVVPIQYSLGRLADPATAMLGTPTSAAPKARTQTRMRLSTESLRTGSERGLQLTPSPSDWQDLGGPFPPVVRFEPTCQTSRSPRPRKSRVRRRSR